MPLLGSDSANLPSLPDSTSGSQDAMSQDPVEFPTLSTTSPPSSLAAKIDESSLFERQNSPSAAPKTYLEKIQTLTSSLPHLKNIRSQTPRQGAKVDCYDFHHGELQSTRTFSGGRVASDFLTANEESLDDTLKSQDDNDLGLRVLVATDLTTGLIECLGSNLAMNPEFFEEHLLNSGWAGSEVNPEADTWVTNDMTKDYVSIVWYRMAKQYARQPLQYSFGRENMLELGKVNRFGNRSKALDSTRQNGDRQFFLHRNIIRREAFKPPETVLQSRNALIGAYEERATIWSGSVGRSTVVVILLDPLPELNERSLIKRPSYQNDDRHQRRARRSTSTYSSTEEEIRTTTILPYIFAPRSFPMNYGLLMLANDLEDMEQTLSTQKTTAKVLQESFNQLPRCERGLNPAPTVLLNCLFSIIQRDMLYVFRNMNSALTDLSQDILDDIKLQNFILYWRSSLAYCDRDLFQIEKSFRGFAAYATMFTDSQNAQPAAATSVEVDKCLQQISDVRHQIYRRSKSLMSSISILESRRGIAEAESVTKITELAFFFIPLTFSASVFSMQVKELGSTNVSLWVFFVVAVVITISSYALRLAIRSALVIGLRRKWMDEVRELEGLPAGSPIPSRMFFRWLCYRLGLLHLVRSAWGVTFLVGTLVSAVLLIVIWTGSLQNGVQIATTVYICAFYLGMIGFTLLHRATLGRRPYVRRG